MSCQLPVAATCGPEPPPLHPASAAEATNPTAARAVRHLALSPTVTILARLPYSRPVPVKDGLFRTVTTLHRAIFRASRGRLLGRAGGMPVVILTTTGRRTGRTRRTMLAAPIVDGDRVVLVASYGGDPRHPAWFLNLLDEPRVGLTLGGQDRPMRARVASAEEKVELWPAIVGAYRGYGAYQRRTDRQIPVVVLEPYAGHGSPASARKWPGCDESG